MVLSICNVLLTQVNRFNELFMGNTPVDRVRGQQLPLVGPTLDYLGKSASLYL